MDVGRDSFALTLYTYWHLNQLRSHDAWERVAERFDLASLVAFAMHDPKQLGTTYEAWLARTAAGVSGIDAEAAYRARALEYVERHKRLVPMDPPPEDAS